MNVSVNLKTGANPHEIGGEVQKAGKREAQRFYGGQPLCGLGFYGREPSMNVREAISFFYSDPKARLGELVVDAFVNETHTFSSEVTEHPIESGDGFVDHVCNLPTTIQIEGTISNTPMTLVGLTAIKPP